MLPPLILIHETMLFPYLNQLEQAFKDFLRVRYIKRLDQIKKESKNVHFLVASSITSEFSLPNLRLLQVPRVGIDNINTEIIPSSSYICNTTGHSTAVSEYILLGMLWWSCEFRKMQDFFKHNFSWSNIRISRIPQHQELRNKITGVIGMGEIGQQVSQLVNAFGGKVYAYSRKTKNLPYISKFFPISEFKEFLSQCDFVIVACAYTPETRNLINKDSFSVLKRNCVIINVARGPCVNEEALYYACLNKDILGACIDVWYTYPSRSSSALVSPSKFPFHKLQNVISTPHISSWTKEAFARRLNQIRDNIMLVHEGKVPINIVRYPQNV